MTEHEKEERIYRLISGKQTIRYGGKNLVILPADLQTRIQAAELYNTTIKNGRFDTCWLTEKYALGLLVSNGLCSKDIDNNLKEIEKEIEKAKIDIFKSMYVPENLKRHRKRLAAIRKKQAEMFQIRHSLDHLTLAGFAEMMRRQFLIYNTLYCDDKKVWQDFDSVDAFTLENLANKILKEALTQEQIREIARTEPWHSFWSIKKTDIFTGDICDLTDEQRSLILFSRMYDSVREHPECPTDTVIADDDMFDGWMLIEQRKRDQDRMTKQLDKRLGEGNPNMANAGEVGIVVTGENEEERLANMKDIQGMNDLNAKMTVKKRMSLLKNKRKAVDTDFSDVQSELQQQRNEQFMKVRGRQK